MTREEAIRCLSVHSSTNGSGLCTDKQHYEAKQMAIKALEQEPCEDIISRKSIKQKLQEHHDFFVNAYGGFSNLPQNDKSRVDEITNCIAMVVNEPPVIPQEPILDKIRAEVKGKILKRPWLDFEDMERDRNDAFLEVLDIIDKYKAESEALEQESFMNKPCVAHQVCHEDKVKVIDKIRTEIVHLHDWAFDRDGVLKIIDRYRAESGE